MAKALDGIAVLVTRPVHQAENLCTLIERQGGKAIRFPSIEIAEPRDKQKLAYLLHRLKKFDIAIFISPNAVDRAFQAMMHQHGGLPEHIKVAAVGKGSARQLNKHGVSVDIFPSQQFNSEALLAMDEMQAVAAKRIVIFRGEGGRELLADTLSSRGAIVEYAECYRRCRPEVSANELLEALSQGVLDIITATSNEGLQNLYDMVADPGKSALLKIQLIVVSERSKRLAEELGFTKPAIIAHNASDEMLIEAIVKWQETRPAS